MQVHEIAAMNVRIINYYIEKLFRPTLKMLLRTVPDFSHGTQVHKKRSTLNFILFSLPPQYERLLIHIGTFRPGSTVSNHRKRKAMKMNAGLPTHIKNM